MADKAENLTAERLVERILLDLMDRRALRQTWNSFDDETRDGIAADWEAIILATIAALKERIEAADAMLNEARRVSDNVMGRTWPWPLRERHDAYRERYGEDGQ